MRLDSAPVPDWPATFRTRDEAITAALALMDPGDVFWIHAEECAMGRDLPCDCVVTMVPALTGLVQ